MQASNTTRRPLPFFAQVLLGVAIGCGLGSVFGQEVYLGGLSNERLGDLGLLVIRLLKTLATPLVLLGILDAFLHTDLSGRQGLRLIAVCALNVTVAMLIGLTLMNVFTPGLSWSGHLTDMTAQLGSQVSTAPKPPAGVNVSLDPLRNLSGYVPTSLLDPLLSNNIVSVVLLGLLAGAALRRERSRQQAEGQHDYRAIEQLIGTLYRCVLQMLLWVVATVPYAVLGVVAHVVGKAGIGVFNLLWAFLATLLAGMALHSLVYYPALAWWSAGLTPRRFLRGGADAIVTGLSGNSSLAAMPITLRCLTENFQVSQSAARLSTCVGTNLNNDGITLYEAMAALFLAQALGLQLDLGQQLTVVAASLMAGIGVAGVPEAGLIVLPLVLGAAGLPENIVAAAIPLILPVDWIIARCRSAVNVMNDMLVAIVVDRWERQTDEAH